MADPQGNRVYHGGPPRAIAASSTLRDESYGYALMVQAIRALASTTSPALTPKSSEIKAFTPRQSANDPAKETAWL